MGWNPGAWLARLRDLDLAERWASLAERVRGQRAWLIGAASAAAILVVAGAVLMLRSPSAETTESLALAPPTVEEESPAPAAQPEPETAEPAPVEPEPAAEPPAMEPMPAMTPEPAEEEPSDQFVFQPADPEATPPAEPEPQPEAPVLSFTPNPTVPSSEMPSMPPVDSEAPVDEAPGDAEPAEYTEPLPMMADETASESHMPADGFAVEEPAPYGDLPSQPDPGIPTDPLDSPSEPPAVDGVPEMPAPAEGMAVPGETAAPDPVDEMPLTPEPEEPSLPVEPVADEPTESFAVESREAVPEPSSTPSADEPADPVEPEPEPAPAGALPQPEPSQQAPEERAVEQPAAEPEPEVPYEVPAPDAPARVDSAVIVDVAGPEELYVGSPCEYVLTVRNRGSVVVHGVQLVAHVFGPAGDVETEPEGTRAGELLLWDIGTLEGGAERSIRVRFVPQREGDVGVAARVIVAAQVAHRTRITRPRLALVKVGPKQVEVGETVRFLITVSNPGTGTARNVVLRDQMPDGFQHPAGTDLEYEVGDLKPGETREIPLEVVATRAGRFTNVAVAVAEGGLEARAEATVLVTQAKLSVSKHGPPRRYLGSHVSYEIVVRNEGTAPARGVVVEDHLPAGLRPADLPQEARWDQSSGRIRWQLGLIEPGGVRRIGFTCLAVQPGEQRNRVVVTAQGGIRAEAECITTVVAVPALLIEVVDTDDPLEVGAETLYEIRLVNQGTKPIAGVTLVVEIPEGMEFIAAEAPAGFRVEPGRVIFDSLPPIAPRANAAFYLRMRGLTPGDKRLRVRVQSGPFGVSILEEESTRVYDGG